MCTPGVEGTRNHYVLVTSRDCQSTKEYMIETGIFDRERALYLLNDHHGVKKIALPLEELQDPVQIEAFEQPYEIIDTETLSKLLKGREVPRVGGDRLQRSLGKSLQSALQQILIELNDWDESLGKEIPSRWEKHGDLILFPPNAFIGMVWDNERVWETICGMLKAKRLARRAEIQDNKFRSPQITMLFGHDTWVHHVDNGIAYHWDISKCMFSAGNITEKLRIASWDCRGETVVDLFAGIGYFSLPYLIYAKCDFLHACDWNPASVEALELNLEKNKVSSERYKIHFGDNRETCPENVAHRVNLGLIPSAQVSYLTACKALKRSTGGILHIHGNVKRVDNIEISWPKELTRCQQSKHLAWDRWARDTSLTIRDLLESLDWGKFRLEILDIVRIKSYAPKVDHVVLDLKVVPNSS